MHKNAYANPASLPRGRAEAPSPLSNIANESESNELPTQILQKIADPRTQHTDLLLTEEMARAQSWSMWVMAMCLVALAFVPLLPASPTGQWVLGCTMMFLACTAFWTWRAAACRRNYTQRLFRFFGYSASTASFVLEFYLGVFSPTPLVVTLGITFFGTGMDRKHARWICLYAGVGYLVLALLTTLGWIPHGGGVPTEAIPTITKIFFTCLCPMAMFVSLTMAFVSRTSLNKAVEQAAEAQRLSDQRDTQLQEAHHALKKALVGGIHQRGRYSGCMAGQWKLGEIIGRGGMAEVYQASSTLSDELAAVKVLGAEWNQNPTQFERFEREGALTKTLDHPSIVRVYDVGRLEDNVPFMAMELLTGVELAALLRNDPVLPASEVIQMVHHIAAGLDFAHDAGVIHRDLKPENVFYCKATDQWKILDFGVSKHMQKSTTLTEVGKIVGTPHYMSPEQARADSVDHRTDLFALGALAYRALTGCTPFTGRDLPSLLYAVVYAPPLPCQSIVPTLPAELDNVFATALAKAPHDRYQRAKDFSNALIAALLGTVNKINDTAVERPSGGHFPMGSAGSAPASSDFADNKPRRIPVRPWAPQAVATSR